MRQVGEKYPATRHGGPRQLRTTCRARWAREGAKSDQHSKMELASGNLPKLAAMKLCSFLPGAQVFSPMKPMPGGLCWKPA